MHYPYVTLRIWPSAPSFTGWTVILLNSLSAASWCNVGADFPPTVLKSHFRNSGKSCPRLHHQATEKVRPAGNIYLLVRDSGVELASFPLSTRLTEPLWVSTRHHFSFTSPAETRFMELGNTSSENACTLLNFIKKRLFHLMVLHVIWICRVIKLTSIAIITNT